MYPTLSSRNKTLEVVQSTFSITSFLPNVMNLVSTTPHTSMYFYNTHLSPKQYTVSFKIHFKLQNMFYEDSIIIPLVQ